MSRSRTHTSSDDDTTYHMPNDPFRVKRKYTKKQQGEAAQFAPPLDVTAMLPATEPPKKTRRQVMKVHGISRDPDGNLLFAVSFAKAKTFCYITNEVMKSQYPTYLIGFYEKNIHFGNTVTLESLQNEK